MLFPRYYDEPEGTLIGWRVNMCVMSRKLSPEDIQLLKKLVPELVDPTCTHAGHGFRSVLPPVSMHFSASSGDFRERLMRLSDGEIEYLVGLIHEGMESLHCVKKEHVGVLIDVVGTRISKVRAAELLDLYTFIGD